MEVVEKSVRIESEDVVESCNPSKVFEKVGVCKSVSDSIPGKLIDYRFLFRGFFVDDGTARWMPSFVPPRVSDVDLRAVWGVIDKPGKKPVLPQVVPANIVLPPSSANINLEGIPVLDLFAAYSFLRSFSTRLFLSPFKLDDFVAALKATVCNQLIDDIHVSILLTLRKHLELLASDGCESALTCLRNLNWDLLDVITWPIYMVEYLLIHGSGLKPGFTLNSLKLFDGEYYKQSAEVKVALLSCLCDDVVQVEHIKHFIDVGEEEPIRPLLNEGNEDKCCCLCKMDGNLICCDGCPAVYHSKCVGIVGSLSLEGDWYCPECVVSRKTTSNQKHLRGAELLGIDPEGRSFFCCFDYLLVLDSFDAEGSCSYYHKDDLTAVIQLLKSSTITYGSILSAISEHWDFKIDLYQHRGSGEGSSTISSNAQEEDAVQRQPGGGYMNSYSFARTAASVFEELLTKRCCEAILEFAPKTDESKVILKKALAKSCWPTIQDLNRERQKEKCGWCHGCRYPVIGKGCLLIARNPTCSIPLALKAEVDNVVPERNTKGHLVDVICCVLCMEERLRGLLSGPWLTQLQYRELWRHFVLDANDVSSLKDPLLMLEANLHPLALSADWWKHVDLVTTMGSASHSVTNSGATTKIGISIEEVRYADSETKSAAGSRSALFWWRGGKISRSLFNWKVVPRSLALKVARKAGYMKIPDILYPDGSESARRPKRVAWRAAVETSTSLEQLALQVRELDLFIRWDDIENTHPQDQLDKESINSMKLFEKVEVRQKILEGSVARYLLDFGNEGSIPDVVLKHGNKLEDSSCERKKFWLDEEYVPLYLLKSFGEEKITQKSVEENFGKMSKTKKTNVVKKPLQKKDLSIILSERAERLKNCQCGFCKKIVPRSGAVFCQRKKVEYYIEDKNIPMDLRSKQEGIPPRIKHAMEMYQKLLEKPKSGNDQKVSSADDSDTSRAEHKRPRCLEKPFPEHATIIWVDVNREKRSC